MMNERIAKLYDQAIVIEDGGDYVCGELDPVKFAELIVKECVDIASQEDFDVMMKEGYPCSQTAKKIKQHFGVEE
jgi:hypothetical protein